MDAVEGPNAAVLFTLLVGLATAGFKFLLGIISKQDAQIQASSAALLESNKTLAEISAFLSDILKENLEWKERYESLRVEAASASSSHTYSTNRKPPRRSTLHS